MKEKGRKGRKRKKKKENCHTYVISIKLKNGLKIRVDAVDNTIYRAV